MQWMPTHTGATGWELGQNICVVTYHYMYIYNVYIYIYACAYMTTYIDIKLPVDYIHYIIYQSYILRRLSWHSSYQLSITFQSWGTQQCQRSVQGRMKTLKILVDLPRPSMGLVYLPSRELTYPPKMAFWRWFPFPKVGYVYSPESTYMDGLIFMVNVRIGKCTSWCLSHLIIFVKLNHLLNVGDPS